MSRKTIAKQRPAVFEHVCLRDAVAKLRFDGYPFFDTTAFIQGPNIVDKFFLFHLPGSDMT